MRAQFNGVRSETDPTENGGEACAWPGQILELGTFGAVTPAGPLILEVHTANLCLVDCWYRNEVLSFSFSKVGAGILVDTTLCNTVHGNCLPHIQGIIFVRVNVSALCGPTAAVFGGSVLCAAYRHRAAAPPRQVCHSPCMGGRFHTDCNTTCIR